MSMRVGVAILGGSGYGAGELLRLLTQHPAAEVAAVVSRSSPGAPVDRVHPHLRGFYGGHGRPALCMSVQLELDRLLAFDHAVLFSALPHGESGTAIEALLREAESHRGGDRLRIVDLSGDFRLRREREHRRHYPESPLRPGLRERFVYGLPELNREQIRAARCIANPGCLATAAILAAAPLARDGAAGPLVIDAKTGSSGSGRELKESTHHPTRHADFRAYKPLAHQHEPEIRQALWGESDEWGTGGQPVASDPHGGPQCECEDGRLSFVAQSMDAARGIFVTVHATLPGAAGMESLAWRYTAFYEGSPFVRVVEGSPSLQNVVGSNFCDVSVAVRGRQVITMAALDNLVKGMAGTAIQNMNLMCGLTEETGLWWPAARPV